MGSATSIGDSRLLREVPTSWAVRPRLEVLTQERIDNARRARDDTPEIG
jgi:hypothetical protein